MATGEWTDEQLRQVGRDRELRIAAYRDDGTLRREVPVWAVVEDDTVVVRSWYRKARGWNATAARSGRARIGSPGGPVDVCVQDAGSHDPGLRRRVDDAYRAKYGGNAGAMVTDDAAGTTLRLRPDA